jgi:DNA-binding FadR family transcriptional regulator
MSIKRIAKSSVVEAFITQLRKAIEEGVYAPGTHLNQEDLAAAAGLSRTPVRLALLAMAREGLLAESTQGYRVVRLDVEEALDMFEIHYSAGVDLRNILLHLVKACHRNRLCRGVLLPFERLQHLPPVRRQT